MSACKHTILSRLLLVLAVGWLAVSGGVVNASGSPAGEAPVVEPAPADAPADASADAFADAPGAAPGARPGARALVASDPFESLNRKVFLVNGVLDHFLIKPVAEAYEYAMPRPARQGVDNFIGNIGDLWSAMNLVMQGKPGRAVEMTLRFGINTVLGMGGLLDVAGDLGIERQSEDFGQTLAVWGVPAGGYLVLPIFGPSTLRDTAAMPLDRSFRNQFAPSGESQRWRWVGAQAVHGRADVLPFTRMLDTVALDKYVYVRDAYLARRRSLVFDGDPPPMDDEDGEPAPKAPAATQPPKR